ncbi:hypothetical protein HMPREF9628_01352 [Peptoanaerobacter stomatis]|uniref:Stage 0 sporulation protein A homolog n=1 Tax=Peptoanaerobacter stomatis TaxID=796937 RepID=G9XBI5_9FIRM|nr:response regulator [Peptoanaerobacter stomatis]EHL19663.1 hypothetical protein HMPREF9628_01352 [Peptoanaerobacter stomatis]
MYKVLIVDDEELVRQAIAKIVSSIENFEVEFFAKNGQEALDICKNERVDIVFMDIMMPIKDGIAASREILEINPDISIYIVSSYNSFELAQRALKNKIKQYVIKPIDSNTIKSILTNFKVKKQQEEVLISVNVNKFIEENDFYGLYDNISVVAKEIYNNYSQSNFKDNMYRFISAILYSFLPEVKKNKLELQQLFPLQDIYSKDERLIFIWLFKVYEYIFIKRSEARYPILKDIFSYIESNIVNNISLNDIVKNCNLSQGYLSRIFKKEFNMTVMNYIHIKKINIAKEYICLSRMNISEIFFKVGYNEFSYFCKVFKKYEKTTVSRFRNYNKVKLEV